MWPRRLCLDLLCAPASIRLAHVRGWLDGRDELERGVRDTDKANYGAKDDLPCRFIVENDAADEDIDWFAVRQTQGRRSAPRAQGRIAQLTDTAADEGEEERGVAGDLRRDLELEKTGD